MAWDEWEQLKRAAAERHGTQMQLNQFPADITGDTGGAASTGANVDLKASKGPWTRASGVAKELHLSAQSGLTELTDAHAGVGGGTDGFACTAALEEVRSSWDDRLTAVRDECDRLEGALARTGRDFGELDPSVAAKVGGVRVGHEPSWAR